MTNKNLLKYLMYFQGERISFSSICESANCVTDICGTWCNNDLLYSLLETPSHKFARETMEDYCDSVVEVKHLCEDEEVVKIIERYERGLKWKTL